MTICRATIIPKFSLVPSMMLPRQADLAWRRMNSFWDGIMVLLMNLNQNLTPMFKSSFSMGAPISSHFIVPYDISGVNHFFMFSKVFVQIR